MFLHRYTLLKANAGAARQANERAKPAALFGRARSGRSRLTIYCALYGCTGEDLHTVRILLHGTKTRLPHPQSGSPLAADLPGQENKTTDIPAAGNKACGGLGIVVACDVEHPGAFAPPQSV